MRENIKRIGEIPGKREKQERKTGKKLPRTTRTHQ